MRPMGRTLTSKTEDEADNLIKEMTLNNDKWFNERAPSKKA